ncbi:MAG: dTMP kinase [cyanobacterium endosymbiont of Rhopalodia musculus]|uniref:dTMP kinase n=1 Tax=cyanobacterium endosymbiont of Epithemia clementina EcSB TaxID=3034674 RepID=UPI002480AE06|nr:dTMP kinase [cyanobacterium endosymbiont of Epithemia clementina EcSB]WGT67458.1 dTMP kinase [cyanobacterium endosymbiont of Epithemia clementina EcSB]
MKSLFIVLEGIDRAGKSTQAELLKNYFLTHQQQAVISSEPTDGPIGRLIREAMQSKIIAIKQKESFDEQMAYLFTADRYYHLFNDINGVYKLINENHTHVIATRYYFSSLAYNCNTKDEFSFVAKLNQRFPDPDVVFYINISLKIALSRLNNHSMREIYETEKKLRKVRHNYENIFKTYEGKIFKLDGSKSIEEIHKKILTYLKETFSSF